ncbi:MAG TPA: RHS repeat-associated core domain-containing protein [Armatimonadota bacterium]
MIQLHETFSGGNHTIAAPFGYQGQWGAYTDAGTGLVLMTHRYYDPATGRWLTRDPIGYNGGINLYGYVGGDPVNGSDPSGYSASLALEAGQFFLRAAVAEEIVGGGPADPVGDGAVVITAGVGVIVCGGLAIWDHFHPTIPSAALASHGSLAAAKEKMRQGDNTAANAAAHKAISNALSGAGLPPNDPGLRERIKRAIESAKAKFKGCDKGNNPNHGWKELNRIAREKADEIAAQRRAAGR